MTLIQTSPSNHDGNTHKFPPPENTIGSRTQQTPLPEASRRLVEFCPSYLRAKRTALNLKLGAEVHVLQYCTEMQFK